MNSPRPPAPPDVDRRIAKALKAIARHKLPLTRYAIRNGEVVKLDEETARDVESVRQVLARFVVPKRGRIGSFSLHGPAPASED